MRNLLLCFALVVFTKASFACTASFSVSGTGLSRTFINTSSGPSWSGTSLIHASWSYGDGTPMGSSISTGHTYSTAGTYVVSLVMQWVDSASLSVICVDSVHDTITVSTPIGVSGTINRDTAHGPLPMDSLMVWLITYDTTTHIISAIDSQRVVAWGMFTSYSFTGVTAGNYLVKAASTFGSSGSGFVPTYHYSSLSWSGAGYVTVGSGMSTGNDIAMQYGTLSSGPGFIAGDVTMGAGKGTAVGDPVIGLQIYLINTATGKLVSATTTDATGNYSFHVPYGTYTIQPEKAGLYTTSWPSITVSAAAKNATGISFKENSTSIKPVTSSVPTATAAADIAIYPNPAHDQLSIQWNGATAKTAVVTMTNAMGQKVMQSNINIAGTESKLNIAQLQPGVYFMNVRAGEMNYNNKITIK